MKAGKFIVAGLLFCTVGLNTACSVVKDAKDANNMEKEGNAIAASVNSEKKALMNDGVYLDLPSSYSWIDWSSKPVEKKAELRTRLTKMVNQLTRYIEIAHHKNMKLKGDGTTANAETVREGAMKYINSLDKHENKAQTYKQFEIS